VAERKSFLLRLPADLLEELNRWSRDELRSLNAQIEYLLRDAVRRHRRARLDPPGDNPSGPAADPGDVRSPRTASHPTDEPRS
jgi:hypothetical protein